MHEIGFIFLGYGIHHHWHPISLTTTASSAEVEALKGQIALLTSSLEAITKASKQMADSFKDYVTAIQIFFGLLVFGTTFLGAVAAWFYGKSLIEARQTIDTEVKSEVNRQLKTRISGRIRYLEDVIEREEIIGKINIEYFVPGSKNIPAEHDFLKARGFTVNYNSRNANLNDEILILDLVNSKYSESNEFNDQVFKTGKKIADKNQKLVLIIYVHDHLDAIKELPPEIYYLPANSKVALMGAVVNAANISYALNH